MSGRSGRRWHGGPCWYPALEARSINSQLNQSATTAARSRGNDHPLVRGGDREAQVLISAVGAHEAT